LLHAQHCLLDVVEFETVSRRGTFVACSKQRRTHEKVDKTMIYFYSMNTGL